MPLRDFFYKNRVLDRLYMNVLRPVGFLLLMYPRDCWEIAHHRNRYDYLQKYQNIHKGERCFIVGTGPSLTEHDLELIKNERIFGVNALCLWERYKANIDYFFIGDDCAFKKLYDEIPENTFVASQCADLVRGNKKIQPLPVNRFSSFWPYKTKKFSLNACKVIYSFNSVIFLAIQMAIYMGFTEIYLLGVDCNYNTEKMYAVDHGIRHSGGYMKEAGAVMIENFKFVKRYLQKKRTDIAIYNASSGGMLEVFPRVNLKQLFTEQ